MASRAKPRTLTNVGSVTSGQGGRPRRRPDPRDAQQTGPDRSAGFSAQSHVNSRPKRRYQRS